MNPHPYLDTHLPIAFAHRGGASDAPENTMPAFAHAINLGYQYLETDVHATRDGVLLAFHDDDLQRTCNMPGKISELDYATVKHARVSGSEPIPLLTDILNAWPNARINIDCKSDHAMGPLQEALRAPGVLDKVCVGSFSDKRLTHLREIFGEKLCSSLGPKQVALLRFGSWLKMTRPFANAHCAQIPLKQGLITLTDKRLVDEAHKAGLQVHVWTINDEDEMLHLLDLGVDGIMSDKPGVLKEVFQQKNLWKTSL
ncbi:MAG: glycerophosphodiester phosphodiesterase [Actinobacteria bacterium]|nr:MAG: glycerophosphodiester phosphodiesterase [Actinomycetota bacterium]